MSDFKLLVLDKKNIENFAVERNTLLKNTQTDWVLFLDKDEELKKPINIKLNKNYAYQFTRRNYFLGDYVGSEKIVRLVRKGSGKWVRSVHEYWQSSDNVLVRRVHGNAIIHNTADNIGDYLKKLNIYSGLHAKANKKEGKKSTIFKICVYPVFKFIITYKGSRNVVFSIMQSLHSFLSWTKLYLGQY